VTTVAKLKEQMDYMQSKLFAGFQAEAHTVLDGKLSVTEAEDMLDQKYDAKTAETMETSVLE
jgi:hypothetical protein